MAWDWKAVVSVWRKKKQSDLQQQAAHGQEKFVWIHYALSHDDPGWVGFVWRW